MSSQGATERALIDSLGASLPAGDGELRFLCPQCVKRKGSQDSSGHLYVNVQQGKFNCFRCGWKGYVSYLLKVLGISVHAQVADWKQVASGMSLFTGVKVDESYDNTVPIEYPCEVAHPLNSPAAWNYLLERGLNEQHVNYYQMVVGCEGQWKTRIFIPTLHEGEVVFWVARTFAGQEPKYMNPSGVSKKHYWFGLEQAKQFDWVIVTEGVFSAIAAGPNAIAAFGKSVSKEQREQLIDAGFKTIFVSLDGDARKEAMELCSWLHSRGQDVRLVDLAYGEDPASISDFRQRLERATKYDYLQMMALRLTKG